MVEAFLFAVKATQKHISLTAFSSKTVTVILQEQLWDLHRKVQNNNPPLNNYAQTTQLTPTNTHTHLGQEFTGALWFSQSL